ncbi:Hypothetical predicted protein [Octopus vulgaris]|uniref:Uncharacterized protein n=1 Tax=Octopus vulgaris TaxID=6645 RepID=A0AA36BSH1_OCTVU|nr:Hypothetical predicted protein [Octopus vulgaris]
MATKYPEIYKLQQTYEISKVMPLTVIENLQIRKSPRDLMARYCIFSGAFSLTLGDDRMMALSKEERIPDRMMNLSKEERIELVLLSGREGWSYRKIAEDKPRSGRPKTSDETKEAVEAKVSAS